MAKHSIKARMAAALRDGRPDYYIDHRGCPVAIGIPLTSEELRDAFTAVPSHAPHVGTP